MLRKKIWKKNKVIECALIGLNPNFMGMGWAGLPVNIKGVSEQTG